MHQRSSQFTLGRTLRRRLPGACYFVQTLFTVALTCLALVGSSYAASFTSTPWGKKQVQPSASWANRKIAPRSFAGNWKNVDAGARGITRLEIVQKGKSYRIRAWGKCHPRDCDLGTVAAVAYGSSVNNAAPQALSAVFHQSTGETLFILRLQGGQLTAEVLRQYDPTKAAGRSNYAASYRFASDGSAVGRTSSTAGAGSAAPNAGNASTPSSSAGPPAQGRFRVMITGFTVNHETNDDALQRDGKGDEVYLYTDVAILNPQGKMVDQKKLRTVTMGDTNGWRDRLRAGTRSPKGGLQTGDQYPSSNPWRYSGRSYSDRLPELIWQGVLVQGGDKIVITPTIWEWDRSGDDLWNQVSAFAGALPDVASELMLGLLDFVFPCGETPSHEGCIDYPNFNAGTFGYAESRPIGMKRYDIYRFCPLMIGLDYNAAQRLIKTSQGFGNGVAPLHYADEANLGSGEYTLYVKVEKY